MNKIILIPLFLVVFLSDAFAIIDNMASAINESGRQRMLTQRMLKQYLLIGLDIDVATAQQNLAKAKNKFELNLADLKKFKVNNEISNALNDVDKLWLQAKPLIDQTPKKENVVSLRDKLELLLKASHKVVLLLEKESDIQTGRAINISGRQRMLSQRMANLYLLKAWQFDQPIYTKDLKKAISEFRLAQKELIATKANSKDITLKLKQVKTQFAMFEYALKTKSGKFIPGTINKASDKILVKMNHIVSLYEKL